jgi:hypothetical protein
LSGWTAAAQQASAETFVITISLSSTTIHVGEGPVITMITSNPTDHIVYAGQGLEGGPAVELLNEKGEDIGVHAVGGMSKHPDSGFVLGINNDAMGPRTHTRAVWPLKPEPGYLAPGVYRLRVHRRDVKLGIEVYSNALTLTVVN